MLVLARKLNESIFIGDEVEVVVVDIRGDQIKLGVRAPRAMSVHRAEVYRGIQEQNKKAAANVPKSLRDIEKLFKEDLLKKK